MEWKATIARESAVGLGRVIAGMSDEVLSPLDQKMLNSERVSPCAQKID
jgi:hypothetical protein